MASKGGERRGKGQGGRRKEEEERVKGKVEGNEVSRKLLGRKRMIKMRKR